MFERKDLIAMGGIMKKFGLITLLLTITVMVQLTAEIQYDISDAITFDTPYPFDDIIYNCDRDSLVHFYSWETNDSVSSLFHFSMNSNFEFSNRTLVLSETLTASENHHFDLLRLDNSDVVYVSSMEYYDIKSISKVTNFNQVISTLDISTLPDDMGEQIYSQYVYNDSLLVFQNIVWGEGDNHADFYKYNIDTNELSIFDSVDINEAIYILLDDYLVRFNNNFGLDTCYVYDNQLNYIGARQIYCENFYDDFGMIECKVTSFIDGYLLKSLDGPLPDPNRNWFYLTITDDSVELQYINSYYVEIEKPLIIGSALYGINCPWMSVRDMYEDTLDKTVFDGNNWNFEVNTPISSYPYDVFEQSGYIVKPEIFTNENHGFKVYNSNLEEVYMKDLYDFATLDFRSMFEKIFIVDTENNSLSYVTLSVVSPNSDELNPSINAIISSNYPNPFNPTTTIEYSVPVKGNVSIDIYNILGQRVDTIVNSEHVKGKHTIQWDGKDSDNNALPSGIYFYKVSQNGKSVTKKIVMMK